MYSQELWSMDNISEVWKTAQFNSNVHLFYSSGNQILILRNTLLKYDKCIIIIIIIIWGKH